MTTRPRPFQFSLRTLIIVMTALAVVCSGLFAGPLWATVLTALLLTMLTPVAFTVAVIYGRGYLRTFSIGALFPGPPLVEPQARVSITGIDSRAAILRIAWTSLAEHRAYPLVTG